VTGFSSKCCMGDLPGRARVEGWIQPVVEPSSSSSLTRPSLCTEHTAPSLLPARSAVPAFTQPVSSPSLGLWSTMYQHALGADLSASIMPALSRAARWWEGRKEDGSSSLC
jgi:hypothetical protein